MKRMTIIMGAILVLLTLSGCGLFPGADGGTEVDLSGTSWTLESYDGKALVGETAMTAKFLLGEITGTTSCNQYFGAYEAKGGQLTIDGLGWTEMACMDPEGIMEQESAIMNLLSKTASYQMENGKLILQISSGEELVFDPAE